jgi:hypothetical protein
LTGAGAVAVVVAALAGALGDQTAPIASEKTVVTPRIASTTKPLATSALVLSAVILCWPSGWSAIRGRVYRQSHRRGDNMRLSTRVSPGRPHALAVVVAAGLAGAILPASAQAAAPKYFFQLREVKGGPDIDPALKEYAGEALKADLAGRPEWASDVQAASPEALLAELNKRKLRGFNVTVRFEEVKKEVKPPKPGGRFNQLAVNVRLTVFGTTVAEEKLAFSGDGEAGTEAEVSEKRVEKESMSLTKDAIKDAVKQAVDQAVLKLSVAQSGPHGARKKKK